jgi:hypothetical protein
MRMDFYLPRLQVQVKGPFNYHLKSPIQIEQNSITARLNVLLNQSTLQKSKRNIKATLVNQK